MIDNQLDLFIKSDKQCKCNSKHALTAHEFDFCLSQMQRIKKLILDHGWNLSHNYFYYMDKLDNTCNAWDPDNSDYLILRANYQEKTEKTKIRLKRR